VSDDFLPLPFNDPNGLVTISSIILDNYIGSFVIDTLLESQLNASGFYTFGQYPQVDYINWRFMTVANWGETSTGNWTIIVTDKNGPIVNGTFNTWSLVINGVNLNTNGLSETATIVIVVLGAVAIFIVIAAVVVLLKIYRGQEENPRYEVI